MSATRILEIVGLKNTLIPDRASPATSHMLSQGPFVTSTSQTDVRWPHRTRSQLQTPFLLAQAVRSSATILSALFSALPVARLTKLATFSIAGISAVCVQRNRQTLLQPHERTGARLDYTNPPNPLLHLMAPIALPRAISGEDIRQVSRSISAHLAPSDNSPSLATRVLNVLSRITQLTSRQPIPPAPIPSSSFLLSRRQTQILAIPTTYQGLNAGPQPGTVVGIVLGSVAGFLLILWLIYTCASLGGNSFNLPWGGGGGRDTTIIEEEVIHRRSRSPRPSRSRSRSETIEVASTHRSPSRRGSSRRETIVVEERRTSRPAPPPEDDIVEVIEEHSPVRRTTRKESRRTSGFRTVDPAEFGGGDRPMRKVSRR